MLDCRNNKQNIKIIIQTVVAHCLDVVFDTKSHWQYLQGLRIVCGDGDWFEHIIDDVEGDIYI